MRLRPMVCGIVAATIVSVATPGFATSRVAAQTAPTVGLDAQTASVTGDGTVGFTLRVRGLPADEPAGVRVRFGQAARSVADLRRAFTGAFRSTLTTSAEVPIGDLPADDAGRRRLDLAIDDGAEPVAPGAVRLTRPGVYPVEVQVRRRGRTVATVVSAVIRRVGDVRTPVPVSVVWPVDDVEGQQLLARQALAHPGLPVTLAPRFVPGSPISDDLRAASSAEEVELLARPSVDLDVGAIAEAGLERLVDRAVGEGVAGVPGTRPLGLLVDPGGPGRRALPLLLPARVDTLVGRADLLAAVPPKSGPFTLGGRRAIVAAAGVDPYFVLGGALGAQRLLADLAVRAVAGETDHVLVLPPADWDVDDAMTSSVLDALADGVGYVQPRRIADWPTGGARVVPGGARAAPDAWRVTSVAGLATRLESVALMVEPAGAAGHALVRRTEQHLVEAVARSASTTDRRDDRTAAAARLRRIEGALALPRGQSTTLVAKTGVLPLSVTNRSGLPLRASLSVISDRLEVPGGRARAVVVVGAAHAESVEVQVRGGGAYTRIPVLLTLTSPDGRLEIDDTRLEVQVTATSGVGVVLTIGAGVVLAAWWITDLRARRRARGD